MELFIALLIIFALIGGAVAIGKAQQKKLLDAGKIIKRKSEFWDEEETFTCAAPFDTVVNAARATDFSDCKATVEYCNNGIVFSNYYWTSSLEYAGTNGDKYVYKYSVHSYKTRKGVVQGALVMNVALTSIEKIFLSLDPGTSVEVHRIKRKTRSL